MTFSTSYIYNFELVANDYFESTTVTGTVNSGFVPMHFRAGGKGVGIGMRSTKEAFEVGMPFFLGGLENFHAKHSLPYGTDLNTVTQPGSYRITADPVNAPSGSAWGQMLVIYGGGDTIAQLVFPYNSDAIWRRSGNPSNVGGSGSWRSWTLVGGNVAPYGSIYNATNGVLIDICPDALYNMVLVEVIGNGFAVAPISTLFQVYHYTPLGVLQGANQKNMGSALAAGKFLIDGGRLKLWFPKSSDYQTFIVRAYIWGGESANPVVTNAAEPASSYKVTCVIS